ncbi:MAG TPA: DUF3696 domain-containing protein, partial [Bryobacteraceae bacterium]|nr:DUF3696 domain-containing protein [Bryobacteraceae bacterium]
RMLSAIPVDDEVVSGSEDEVNGEVNDLPEQSRIALIDLQKNLVLDPNDVGVGISQVVPIVTAALARDVNLVAIEQPELHVHPRLQVAMGDLLIVGAIGEPGESDEPRCLLVETHSEHLLLRILRRIRETTESGGSSGLPPVTPEDVAVLYVKPEARGSTVRQLRIGADGDFIDKWPSGFFEERGEELFA